MTDQRLKPGMVRDAIVDFLRSQDSDSSVAEIISAVRESLGPNVSRSSVQSYLNLNVGTMFVRTSRGRYRLVSQ